MGAEPSPSGRPWMGLASYTTEESDLFKGRDQETHALMAVVERDRLGVLFGSSGVGKTSLLHAGLFPALQAKNFLPVHIRLGYDGEARDLEVQVWESLTTAARKAGLAGPPDLPSGDGLWELFHRKGHRFWTEAQWAVTPVLVLDQFEEIFTVGREDDDRRRRSRRFLESLSELVDNRPPKRVRQRALTEADALDETFVFEPVPVRVILSLREDYLAYLEGLRDLFPTIRQNRLRLTSLTHVQARQAVEGPGNRFQALEPGASDAILHFLTASGAAVEDPVAEERPIEPALLSLVCDELFSAGNGRITKELVRAQQQGILRRFYDDSFQVIPEAERARVRRFVEEQLVSPGGHRDSRALDDATLRSGISLEDLAALVGRRLLRYEERPSGGRRIELSHDRLLDVAKESRLERQQHEALVQVELEQAALLEQARQNELALSERAYRAQLREHEALVKVEMVISFLRLRRGVGLIGFALPAVLVLGQFLFFEPIVPPSMSDYYYSGMRNVLVGGLCAMGGFLATYRGYDRSDRVAGKLASVFAIGAALLPTAGEEVTTRARITGLCHTFCLAGLFLTLAFFCLLFRRSSSPRPTVQKLQRNRVYAICGLTILVSIQLITVYSMFFRETALAALRPVFFLEALAVSAFGFSWLVKGELILKDR